MALNRPEQLIEMDSGDAHDMWQAYNAMETTKRRHFAYLEILDQKKKNYNLDPTLDEQHKLDCLLKDHDQQVRQFTRASKALKASDAAAHASLFAYIAAISQDQVSGRVTH